MHSAKCVPRNQASNPMNFINGFPLCHCQTHTHAPTAHRQQHAVFLLLYQSKSYTGFTYCICWKGGLIFCIMEGEWFDISALFFYLVFHCQLIYSATWARVCLFPVTEKDKKFPAELKCCEWGTFVTSICHQYSMVQLATKLLSKIQFCPHCPTVYILGSKCVC